MTDWPANLPREFLVDGFEEEMPENRLRTENDAGPPKLRRRTSQNISRMRGAMIMDQGQKDEFIAFVEDILIGGTQQFTFPNPAGGSHTCRFGEELPRFNLAAPALWRVRIDLEVLP